jgi:hypothetical protein
MTRGQEQESRYRSEPLVTVWTSSIALAESPSTMLTSTPLSNFRPPSPPPSPPLVLRV